MARVNLRGQKAVLLFVPFYALSLVVSDPTSPIVQIFTFHPNTAPFTAMLRNGLGSLPGWQAAIVITELFVLGRRRHSPAPTQPDHPTR